MHFSLCIATYYHVTQYHAHQFIAMLQGMFCHLCNTFKGSTSAQDMPSHHWTASPMSTQHHFPHYNTQHSLSSAALTIPAFSVPRARIPPQWPDHRMCMNSQFLIYLTGSPPEFHTHNSENTGVQTKFAKNATRNKKAMKSKIQSQLRKVWKLSKILKIQKWNFYYRINSF